MASHGSDSFLLVNVHTFIELIFPCLANSSQMGCSASKELNLKIAACVESKITLEESFADPTVVPTRPIDLKIADGRIVCVPVSSFLFYSTSHSSNRGPRCIPATKSTLCRRRCYRTHRSTRSKVQANNVYPESCSSP